MNSSRVPFGISAAGGAVLVVVACSLAALVPPADLGWRLAVLALALGWFGSVAGDPLAVGAVAAAGYLLFDGFMEGNHGDLVWHGRADLARIAVLAGAGLVGLALGALHRRTG